MKMDRRTLIHAIAAMPIIPLLSSRTYHGPALEAEEKIEVAAAAVRPGKYVVFVDAMAVDFDQLVNTPLPFPDVVMDVIPLRLGAGQTIDDCVRIYEVKSEAEHIATQDR
jgi:hypothetical protein